MKSAFVDDFVVFWPALLRSPLYFALIFFNSSGLIVEKRDLPVGTYYRTRQLDGRLRRAQTFPRTFGIEMPALARGG